jgi:hypothetical protein
LGKFLGFALFLMVGYLIINFNHRQKISDISACKAEADLVFKGIVTEYNGGSEKNSKGFSFILDDTATYTIPRSAFGFPIRVGDTIIKRLKEHRYIVHHNHDFTWPNNKYRDTITYQCE